MKLLKTAAIALALTLSACTPSKARPELEGFAEPILYVGNYEYHAEFPAWNLVAIVKEGQVKLLCMSITGDYDATGHHIPDGMLLMPYEHGPEWTGTGRASCREEAAVWLDIPGATEWWLSRQPVDALSRY